VFRDAAPGNLNAKNGGTEDGAGLISAYLDSFLPVSGDMVQALAAFFTASAAANAVLLGKKQGAVSPLVVALGKHTAPLAEAAGLGRPLASCKEAAAVVLKGAGDFEIASMFSRFLRALLDHVSASLKQPDGPAQSERIAFSEAWRDCAARAESAVSGYNQNPGLALERLFIEAGRAMADMRV
jgi:DNA polymerase-3 subunit gamma/tau